MSHIPGTILDRGMNRVSKYLAVSIRERKQKKKKLMYKEHLENEPIEKGSTNTESEIKDNV